MKTNAFIPIDVLTAEVSTAAIEIKTLTIGRKQVTLAVFRQIQEEPLIAVDRSDQRWMLAGKPWGKVNYCPGKGNCSVVDSRNPSWNGSWKHFHVVWETDGELRRSAIRFVPTNSAQDTHDYKVLVSHLFNLEQLFIAV